MKWPDLDEVEKRTLEIRALLLAAGVPHDAVTRCALQRIATELLRAAVTSS